MERDNRRRSFLGDGMKEYNPEIKYSYVKEIHCGKTRYFKVAPDNTYEKLQGGRWIKPNNTKFMWEDKIDYPYKQTIVKTEDDLILEMI